MQKRARSSAYLCWKRATLMAQSRCVHRTSCNTRAHGIDKVFTSLLSLAPPPPSAHLYLAQLADDDPRLALQHFGTAVEILTQQLKGKDRETAEKSARNDEAEIKGNIVRALIGQVEIWMDPSYDLWQV
jgi:hypothetical protein